MLKGDGLGSVQLGKRLIKAVKILAHSSFRRALLTQGIAAGTEHLGILRQIRPRTVLDVGANVGQFSLAARATVADCEIYAFEPNPRACDKFAALFQQDERVHLSRVALGERAFNGCLHVGKASDNSSLLEATPAQLHLDRKSARVRTESVRVERLDALLESSQLTGPCLLKVDVQGYEEQVLAGGVGLLGSVDAVYLEVSFAALYLGQATPDGIIDLLARHGFVSVGVGPVLRRRDGLGVQADLLFARRSPRSERRDAGRSGGYPIESVP